MHNENSVLLKSNSGKHVMTNIVLHEKMC